MLLLEPFETGEESRPLAASDREVEAIEWTPAARPFFKRQRVCPQGDSNP